MPKVNVPTLRGASFSEVMVTGRKVQGPLLTLFWRHAEERAVGITVGRRVRTAVERNRAKRRLREVVRHSALQIPEGVQIVCVAHPDVAVVPFQKLVEEFQEHLEALRRLGTK